MCTYIMCSFSHLVGVYHCEGTARAVGLELLPQLPPERVEDEESTSPALIPSAHD